MATVPLPRQVAEQAARTPDRIAVVAGGRRLSYAELDARANRLARYLRATGVGPDSLVAVGLRRGLDTAVALLGIWRAGAAYVPLDPDHPRDRLAWILRDTGAHTVLSTSDTAAAVRDLGGRTVCLDTEWPAIAGHPDTAPEPGPEPDHAAYAIYTSGSTGRPKGVVVSHAGIAHRVGWTVRQHRLGPADRVLQKTALTFDAAGWEIFAPLVSGGQVVLPPAGVEADPAAIVQAVAEHRITVLQVVPSVLRLLVTEAGWDRCTALRLVFSAGEPLHAELCHRLLALRPRRGDPVEIWNTYGPTECSIDVTAHRFDPAQDAGPVPIGRPLGDSRVLLLGPEGELVPVGVPGELCAGGPGVGRGYLNNPAQTARCFVPDPYGPPGSRLYRTGDLARWRADGTLEYLGRLDHQVKVNGVRIEPGEVEAALNAHPAVRGAAVTTAERPDGSRPLVAHVVLDGGGAATPAQLRAFLAERLPGPLVPAVVVPIAALPLTSSGKVDRAALPTVDLEAAGPAAPAGFRAPRSVAERAVADAWAGVLSADRIGLDDDFFRLGGSSLRLTRLASRLREATGHTVALADLFVHSTVEAQARLVAAPGTAVPVPRVSRDGPLPVSFGQHRLWILDQMNPGSAEWGAPMLMRLPRAVAPATVRRALELLAVRHEVLRTRYELRGDGPVQVVDPPGPIDLPVVDTGRAELTALLAEDLRTGFDLARGPVWRALLARLDGEDHALLVNFHHIACDGWSSVIAERDLRELCAALDAGREPDLPALPVRYADFARWQRDRLDQAAHDRLLAYWRGALDGLPQLALPTDRPRPAVRDPNGAVVTFTVPPGVAATLQKLGRERGATPFMTMLTAFAVLVARHSGQWDVAVGTPVSQRASSDVDDLVGFFLNAVVLRCRLDPDAGFAAALDAVRETCRAGFGHQDLPFERLVHDLQPARDYSRTPLYQVMFGLQDEGTTSPTLSAADADSFRGAWSSARTDLTLSLQRQRDGTTLGLLEYATALFGEATAARIAGRYVTLLAAVGRAPDQPLSTVDILPAAEREQLAAASAGPQSSWPAAYGPDLIATTTRATPDAPAVICGPHRLSYAELDRWAGQIAARLRADGARPESVIGVYLDRGIGLLPGLLGVWQAGGAYLPLYPATPPDRLAYQLDDAGVDLVVTEPALVGRLTQVYHRRYLLVDDPSAGTPGGPAATADSCGVAADPGRLAYVTYTSGSTGRPKGVLVTHGALANVLLAKREVYGFGPADRWLALAAVSFDIAAGELIMPLLAGGTVVLANEDEVADRAAQLRLVDAHGVTHLGGSPAHWKLLIDAGFGRRPGVVGAMGGEPCPPAFARDIRGRVDRLVNEYGPTEATVSAAWWTVEPDCQAVPIGRPIANATTHVLDGELRPVPAGVLGELYVGGAGVARGYVNQPALTAQRFVPDPFGPPGRRLYRTGDRCRWLPDGTLEFAGRVDDQVKIRSYRIELGEIEAVLAEHPSVAASVAGVAEWAGEKQLIAYWVPAPDGADPATTAALLEHCRRHLPDYMLPALLIPLPRFPLTPHGKVDRAALPAPDFSTRGGEAEHVAPRDPLEKRLAGIWAQVLQLDPGVHDNFFRIGGNSLLAARVMALVQQEFDVEVPLRELFERPTVADLAAAVEAAVRADVELLSDVEVEAYGQGPRT